MRTLIRTLGILQVIDDFAGGAGTGGTPGGEIDRVAEESQMAVAEDRHHASGVPTAGGVLRFLLLDIHAIPIVGVGGEGMVVERVAIVSENPFRAALAIPIPDRAVAG